VRSTLIYIDELNIGRDYCEVPFRYTPPSNRGRVARHIWRRGKEQKMPKREDERERGRREDLRYCLRHKRHYDVNFGCQLCYLEGLDRKKEVEEIPQLRTCPKCKEESLSWNEHSGLYECLNLNCKKTFAQNELAEEKKTSPRSEKLSKQQVSEHVPEKDLNSTKLMETHDGVVDYEP